MQLRKYIDTLSDTFGSSIKYISRKSVPYLLWGLATLTALSGLVGCAHMKKEEPGTTYTPTPSQETITVTPEQRFYEYAKEKLGEDIAKQIISSLHRYDEYSYQFVDILAKNSNLQNQKIFFLTSDGRISDEELEFFNQSQHLSYLTDDLYNLPEIQDGIDASETDVTKKIIHLIESDDLEVQQGLGLIDKYGVPPTRVFGLFQGIPNYNTQLEVLLWLAEDNFIDDDYDRVALALALDYGSVVAIGNDEVDQKVRNYVSRIYEYVKETDRILEKNDLPWRAKDYPLEANIGLVWGANSGVRYPYFYDYVGQTPGPWDTYLYYEFKNREMNLEDFNWLFINKQTLKEIKNWLLAKDFISKDINEIADLVDHYMRKHLHILPEDNRPAYFEVEGKITPGCNISNPNWQWKYFKDKGEIVGRCADVVLADSMFLKSLNISTFRGRVQSEPLKHSLILYYDPENKVLKTTSYQLDDINKRAGEPTITYRVCKIPWDNFHGTWVSTFELESPDRKLLQKGIPIEKILSP